MPTVRFNEQSFNLDGRRIWLVGATLHYARVPSADWPILIERARAAGANTIEVPCPWLVHEPRRGRYDFAHDADVAEFVRLCGEAGLWVILRAGPAIGGGYDGGGIPGWVSDDPDVVVRESSEGFLERATRYLRRLMNEVADQQVSKGGPIILVQIEHEWHCSNPEEEQRYLHEISRVVRESAMSVPLLNANSLWAEPGGTIDTWRGRDDLLANVRQLRVVQPEAPRIVSGFDVSAMRCWGESSPAEPALKPADALRRAAEILAAGAQFIVSPFHAGTNHGFLGGRLPGRGQNGDGFVTTTPCEGAPLDESLEPTEVLAPLRRLMTFAHQFQSVFADLDAEYHPVAVDPESSGNGVSVVPLRGAAGRVMFVFAHGNRRSASLLLDNGGRLPVELGDQPVGWYVVDVDIHGRGRLDYANLCPFAILGRALVVLYGASGADALICVNGTPVRTTVPTGKRPRVIQHMGLSFVICNQNQIDVTHLDPKAPLLHVGIAGFDVTGAPLAASGWAKPVTISEDGSETALEGALPPTRRGRARTLRDWKGATAGAYADGSSPRYASLAGPATLASCGAMAGYGWYRVRFKVSATKDQLVVAPGMAHRMHVYRDGELIAMAGEGAGAETGSFKVKLRKGENAVCALVDNFGRFSAGNDMGARTGLHDHLYAVKAKAGVRSRVVDAPAVDPFAVRGLIHGASRGTGSQGRQVEWTFSHARKAAIVVEITRSSMAGTIVLNDQPIAYFAGDSGAGHAMLVLDPADELFRRGNNSIRFAPDHGQKDALDALRKAVKFHEVQSNLTEKADWSFAKWEPPAATRFAEVAAKDASALKGKPAWWKCSFEAAPEEGARGLETTGLSKGQVYLNGRNVGRYFTATTTGKAVGPQTRLHLPASWLVGDNELLIFDEHGCAPFKAKLV